MLTGRIGPPRYWAFLRVALLALQEELLSFPTTQLADCSGISTHSPYSSHENYV